LEHGRAFSCSNIGELRIAGKYSSQLWANNVAAVYDHRACGHFVNMTKASGVTTDTSSKARDVIWQRRAVPKNFWEQRGA
jgi:hypothetical protein